MVKPAFLALVILLSVPLQAFAQLTATVDKNPALQGEAITLEVTADARVSADAINFRVLEQDFTVMVPSVSTSTQIINGQASQSTSWKVVLLPKKAGTFTIPAFTVQNQSTQPISLQIIEGLPGKDNNANRELFLQTSFEQTRLYVQQLGYYQVTIYFNGDLQRGSLSEPVMDNANIVQVGQDVEGSELVNGIRYRTITRRYAVTPQRSGTFTISPPTFSGEMIDRDSARYNYFARTKTVVQQGQALEVTVSPIPDNFPGNWLVAGLVTLTEEWTPDLTKVKQGEPITRIITLSAVDVADNQLPELNQNYPDSIRVYQEQPQAKSAERNGRLVAQKIFTSAVIANASGEISLPEISLPWWNSQTNQLDYARLPARTLQVEADKTTSTQTTQPAPNNEAAVPNTTQITSATAENPWRWNYLSSLLLALWLFSCLAGYIFWQLNAAAKPTAPSNSRVRFNSTKLKQACQQNDAMTAKAELLRFAHQQLDLRCQSLSELAQAITSEDVKQQLRGLNEALYRVGASWQGAEFWQAWQHADIKTSTNAPETNALKPLYPT